MSQFVDHALLIIKGKNYITKVKELNLISKNNYEKTISIMNSFIATKNEGYQIEIEELSILAAVFTETFYHMNTFTQNVLVDIRFYSENLLRILLYLYDDSVNNLEYFLECSEKLKTIDIDGIYKEMSDSSDIEEIKIVMLKGKLFYSLMGTILENNNSYEYNS
jgi:hypothetical protein